MTAIIIASRRRQGKKPALPRSAASGVRGPLAYLVRIPYRHARHPAHGDAEGPPHAAANHPPRPRDEHDEIARVWMNSWASTGIEDASEALLAKLRAHVSTEVEKGWSLFVADDNGTVAAMLALHRSRLYLDMLFVSPEYQGQNLGRKLLAFTRQQLPDEISLRCVRENEKAWRWYEREGFVFEREAVEPASGFVMKYYRWKRESTPH